MNHLLRRISGSALTCLSPDHAIRAARWIGRGLADGDWPALAQAERNLNHALAPTLSSQARSDLARRSLVEAAACWAEMLFLTRRWNRANWRRIIHIDQPDRWRRLAHRPGGLLLATAYFGNPAVAALAAAELLGSAWLLTWPMSDPNLRNWQQRLLRRRRSLRLLSAGRAATALPRLLDAGHRVVVLAEHQRVKGPAIELSFLGRPHRCYPTIGLLAESCNVPVVVFSARRCRRPLRFILTIEDLIEPDRLPPHDRPSAITHRYMAALQRIILRWPEQYFWTRAWLTDRDPVIATGQTIGRRRLAPSE